MPVIKKQGYLTKKLGPVDATHKDQNLGDIDLWRGDPRGGGMRERPGMACEERLADKISLRPLRSAGARLPRLRHIREGPVA